MGLRITADSVEIGSSLASPHVTAESAMQTSYIPTKHETPGVECLCAGMHLLFVAIAPGPSESLVLARNVVNVDVWFNFNSLRLN
jgi:hypothetical protein